MSFLESIQCLCCENFPDEGLNAEQKKLRFAAKAFLDGDEKHAEVLARTLFSEAQNAENKDMAASLLFALLLWQDRFDEMTPLGLPRNNDDAEQIAVYDTRLFPTSYFLTIIRTGALPCQCSTRTWILKTE